MTTTPRPLAPRPARRTAPRAARRTRAGLALAALGALATSLTATSAQTADAAGDTASGTAVQHGVRLDDLLHPVDVVRGLDVTGDVTGVTGPGDGDSGLSACTGETRTSDVVGPHGRVVHAVFRGAEGAQGKRFTVVQHAADRPTDASAARLYDVVLTDLRGCQHEPAGHWRYGAVHRVGSGDDTAVWMPTIDGSGTSAGAVVVARSGRHVAVAEVLTVGDSHPVAPFATDVLRRLR